MQLPLDSLTGSLPEPTTQMFSDGRRLSPFSGDWNTLPLPQSVSTQVIVSLSTQPAVNWARPIGGCRPWRLSVLKPGRRPRHQMFAELRAHATATSRRTRIGYGSTYSTECCGLAAPRTTVTASRATSTLCHSPHL